MTSVTAHPDILLENLLVLRQQLCAAGFDPGLRRVQAARDLLLALAAQGRLPAELQEWKTWLAPVFCAAPNEQEEFYRRYDLWARQCQELAAQVAEQVPTPAAVTPAFDPPLPLTWRERLAQGTWRVWGQIGLRWLARPFVFVALAILLLLALWLGQTSPQKMRVRVFSKTESEANALPDALVQFADWKENTNGEGRVALQFQLSNWAIWRKRHEPVKITHPGYQGASFDPPESWELLFLPMGLTNLPVEAETKVILQPKQSLALPGPLATVTPTKEPPPPTPSPTPPVVTAQDTSLRPWHKVIIAAPFGFFALWLLVVWLRKLALLERLPGKKVPPLHELRVENSGHRLFASARVRRWLLELRRPRPLSAPVLDVPATVRATIRQSGLFTPVYGVRRISPEYLLLIDRASVNDEQAELAYALFQRMHEHGVFVEPYYFQGDARVCRNALDPESMAVSLGQLAARHPEYRLLVFGDGAEFFDHFTGLPLAWLTQLAMWEQRALLTPNAPARWGYRERELAQRDFALFPANNDGLAALGEWFTQGQVPAPAKPAAAPFPDLIEERPDRWLERARPTADEAELLAEQVRAYLGPEGWDWLCACAVYPQVTWDLTLYLGYWLFGGAEKWREEWAERTLRLVRLPWFRQGMMPDWWREQLLNDLQTRGATDATVRRGIEKLLLSHIEQPERPVKLEYAEPVEPGWRARWHTWRQRLRLRWWLRTQDDPEEPERDFVFLRFLAGQRPSRLGLSLPELLRQVLYRHGQPVLGWRPVTMLLLAGVMSAALWVIFAVRLRYELPERPVIDANPAATVLPTVPPNVSLTPTPTPGPTATVKPTVTPTTSPLATVPGPGEVQDPDKLPPAIVTKGEWPVVPIAGGYRVQMPNGVMLDVVAVPTGSFMMGSTEAEIDAALAEAKRYSSDAKRELFEDERPRRQVSITGFYMGKFEVTQEQWLAVMGDKNPNNFQGKNLPVEQVSWNDATQFCQQLSNKTGVPFRLPSEAEWEYAARAGTTTAFAFGSSLSSAQANFDGNYPYGNAPKGLYREKTTQVGSFNANAWGLFDMHGNVYEWCQDVWHDNYEKAPQNGAAWLSGGDSSLRVLRGGSWDSDGLSCRSALRIRSTPGLRSFDFGFRVVAVSRTP